MQNKTVFSVSQLNEYVKYTLESNPVLHSVFLSGEISNFKSNYASGHLYFSLKDENSSIRAVMFRSSASRLKFRVEGGMKVIVHGRISTYTVSGDYQIIIDDMQPDGAGVLAVAFEQLKKKLDGEGLFDQSRKKAIPKFPKRVGVVTSASGAALHDILNISGRRSPSTEIVIYPSYVQGELAPRSLAGGILFFNNKYHVDTIIIGRGGGSAEDLWCFNDENLARVIASSEIPVISAVGHETDFTICDFVSDMRAPTPSAAAELAFPDTKEILQRVDHLHNRGESALIRRINALDSRLNSLKMSVELASPEAVLNEKITRLDGIGERLDANMRSLMDKSDGAFRLLCARLEGVNPLARLASGYSVVENENGEIVSSVESVDIDDEISIRLSDGSLRARITQKN